MQDSRYREYNHKIQMAGFVPFIHHAAKPAHAAAQGCKHEEMLLRDAPLLFDGSFFIYRHHGVHDDIEDEVIAEDDG